MPNSLLKWWIPRKSSMIHDDVTLIWFLERVLTGWWQRNHVEVLRDKPYPLTAATTSHSHIPSTYCTVLRATRSFLTSWRAVLFPRQFSVSCLIDRVAALIAAGQSLLSHTLVFKEKPAHRLLWSRKLLSTIYNTCENLPFVGNVTVFSCFVNVQ